MAGLAQSRASCRQVGRITHPAKVEAIHRATNPSARSNDVFVPWRDWEGCGPYAGVDPGTRRGQRRGVSETDSSDSGAMCGGRCDAGSSSLGGTLG